MRNLPRPLPKSKRLAIAVAVAVALASTLVVSPAGALPGGLDVALNPGGNQDQAVFLMNIQDPGCVQDPDVTVPGVPDVIVALTDPNTGTITFPVGTPGGSYQVDVTCVTANGTASGSSPWSFASVDVVKQVDGSAPADARFTIAVECTAPNSRTPDPAGSADFGAGPEDGVPVVNASVQFGAAGGTRYLVAYRYQECTVTETDTGGALAATVTTEDCDARQSALAGEATAPSGAFTFLGPASCTQTVVNEFAELPPSPPRPIPRSPAFTG